ECVLPGVAEGGVPQIVGQGDGFQQVLVEAQHAGDGAADLGNLQRVGEAGAEQVALVVDEDLGLVLQPAEGGAVDDTVAVALEFAAEPRRRLGVAAAAAAGRVGSVGRAGDGGAEQHHGVQAPAKWASVRARAVSSKSPVTTASPSARSRTRRSRPPKAFLSTAISSRKRSGAMAGGCSGSSAAASRARTRARSASVSQPSSRDICAAMCMPAATASPCSQLW